MEFSNFINLNKHFSKEEQSWILQDWANSAFSLTVVTAVFPLFYKAVADSAGVSNMDSTAYLGYANSMATATVAFMAPVLGAIAEYKNLRRPLFTAATLIGIFSTLLIAFVPNSLDYGWLILLIIYIWANIGFSSANIFYDASLLDVTTSERMSRVSSTGYGMGYIGSSIPFVIFIVTYVSGILPISGDLVIRGAFILTAVWWFGFTIPYWMNVKQKSYIEPVPHTINSSFKRVWNTLKTIREYRNVFLFLSAYFFYIDGVGTIFKMATAVGADIGLTGMDLLIVMLITQFVAFPFSIIYGILSKWIGDKKMIFIGIFTYLFICFYALSLSSLSTFLILALLVGTAQGGIQSLSRSFFGKLIPYHRHNEFFGFYNIFGKFSSILGTTLMGLITQYTENSLDGIFSLIALFVVGGILLFFVKEPENAVKLKVNDN